MGVPGFLSSQPRNGKMQSPYRPQVQNLTPQALSLKFVAPNRAQHLNPKRFSQPFFSVLIRREEGGGGNLRRSRHSRESRLFLAEMLTS